MSINDVVRLDIVADLYGTPIITSFHFQYQTDLATDQALLTDFRTAMGTLWLATQRPAYNLAGYEVRQVWPGPLDDQRGPVAVTDAGVGTRTSAGEECPKWFAEDIRNFTNARGRSRHGRFFIPVSFEADFVADNLVGSYVTSRDAFVNALFNRYTTGGTSGDYRLGVFSRKFAYVPNTHPPVYDPAAQPMDVFRQSTNLSATGVLSTQRSRRG